MKQPASPASSPSGRIVTPKSGPGAIAVDNRPAAPLAFSDSATPHLADLRWQTDQRRQAAALIGERLGNRQLQRLLTGPGALLQRQETSAPGAVHVGIIPIREFIRHVETVETAYPTRSPQEILTLIRSLYYGSPAGSPGFDRLIPDAPSTGAVETCTDSEGSICDHPVVRAASAWLATFRQRILGMKTAYYRQCIPGICGGPFGPSCSAGR